MNNSVESKASTQWTFESVILTPIHTEPTDANMVFCQVLSDSDAICLQHVESVFAGSLMYCNLMIVCIGRRLSVGEELAFSESNA